LVGGCIYRPPAPVVLQCCVVKRPPPLDPSTCRASCPLSLSGHTMHDPAAAAPGCLEEQACWPGIPGARSIWQGAVTVVQLGVHSKLLSLSCSVQGGAGLSCPGWHSPAVWNPSVWSAALQPTLPAYAPDPNLGAASGQDRAWPGFCVLCVSRWTPMVFIMMPASSLLVKPACCPCVQPVVHNVMCCAMVGEHCSRVHASVAVMTTESVGTQEFSPWGSVAHRVC
jgi:hypothetical protein